jgi:hypothetical protein
MEGSLRALILYLFNKKIIGTCHVPEKKILRMKTKWLKKDQIVTFNKEYKQFINNGILIRVKKKTGKGNDWHISLNPKKLGVIYNGLFEESWGVL